MKRRTVLQLGESTRNNGDSHGHQTHQEHETAIDEGAEAYREGPKGDAAEVETSHPGNKNDSSTGKADIDNKVANFLAEIDALDPGDEDSQDVPVEQEGIDGRASFKKGGGQSREPTPPPPSTKPGAYGMFVKGNTEFTHKSGSSNAEKRNVLSEPWPEEPTTKWQQIKDDSTKYLYYWNIETNEVTWDMPIDFSAYLLKHKEYEEKVEKGLKDGTLKPENKPKSKSETKPGQEDKFPSKSGKEGKEKNSKEVQPSSRSTDKSSKSGSRSRSRRSAESSDSEDSSSDSSSDSSDQSSSKGSQKGGLVPYRKSLDGTETDPVTSTSTSNIGLKALKDDKEGSSRHKKTNLDLPDSTEDKKKKSHSKSEEPSSRDTKPKTEEDEMDFDIDDIDKELEMALERKRQELLKLEDREKKKKDKEDEKDSSRDRRRDDRRDDRKKEDSRRRHEGRRRDGREDRRRDRDRERDRDRDRDKKSAAKEEPKEVITPIPKLTLKDKIRAEVEIKMEKEKRKKKAIEELMAKELERTVASKGRKRHTRDDFDEPRKRRHHDDDYDAAPRLPRDEYEMRRHDDYRRGYDSYDRISSDIYLHSHDRRELVKPPPPTAEMLAYETERHSKVMDYSHGRSGDYDGDADSRDDRETGELKKLEALQLAELALSKLEFLEVTKKGLSKLQILLIELETRHQDWQSGGLTTHHFLSKLREANWQLEQYEESAAPPGWLCHWDRAYRRYYYTHKRTGKTQWDYPDSDDMAAAEEAVPAAEQGTIDSEISSTTSARRRGEADSTHSRSKKSVTKDILAEVSRLPPPPPPPAEEHPVVKGLQLMYGSTSESESDGEPPAPPAPPKKEPTPPPLPPLPPLPSEKHHKSKKKKKSKSKSKEHAEAVVGPHLPAPPPAPSLVRQQDVAASNPSLFDPPPPPPPTDYAPQPDPSAALQFGQTDAGFTTPMDGSGGTFEGVSYPEVSESSYITKAPQLEGASNTPSQPQRKSTVDENGAQMDIVEGNSGRKVEEAAPLVSVSQQVSTEEKKKKKKDKSISGTSIALKKKHVSSLVQKWQKVKKEVEEEEKNREEREAEIRRKLEEWKQDP